MPRKKKAEAKKKRSPPRRLPRRDLSYPRLLTVAKAALDEHLRALRQMRPQREGESREEWLEEMDKIKGLLPVQQAEHVRKCVKDLHELSKDSASVEGAEIEKLSQGEIESAMQELLGNAG